MKTGIRSISVLTALLAGTVIAAAHPHPQGKEQWENQDRRQGCPHCGNPQSRDEGSRQQFRKSQEPREGHPQRRNRMVHQRRRALLRYFDTDRDGQLSKEERQAIRETMKECQRGKPGNASSRPEPPPGEE